MVAVEEVLRRARYGREGSSIDRGVFSRRMRISMI